MQDTGDHVADHSVTPGRIYFRERERKLCCCC